MIELNNERKIFEERVLLWIWPVMVDTSPRNSFRFTMYWTAAMVSKAPVRKRAKMVTIPGMWPGLTAYDLRQIRSWDDYWELNWSRLKKESFPSNLACSNWSFPLFLVPSDCSVEIRREIIRDLVQSKNRYFTSEIKKRSASSCDMSLSSLFFSVFRIQYHRRTACLHSGVCKLLVHRRT